MFVSYARRDDAGKWVTRLVEALRDAAKDNFEVHCDPDKEEFQAHETKPTGPNTPPGIMPLLLEDTSRGDQPDEKHGRWHDRIYRMHGHDLRNVFTHLTVAAVPDELAAQVLLLSDELYQQKQELRRRDTVTGNLEHGTSRFVGRNQALTQLGDALDSPSVVGVVTAVQGRGGIDKTKLVRRYGHLHRSQYTAGISALKSCYAEPPVVMYCWYSATYPNRPC